MATLKKTGISVSPIALLLVGTLLSACSSVQSTLESAQFHLDQGEYTKAIALLEPIVEEDGANLKAVSLLASAHTSRGLLGEDDPDTEANEGGSFLAAFSNYLEGQAAGSSNMESIEAATPAAAANGEADLFRAEDLLDTIAAADKTQENYLQHGITQLGIISVVGVIKIGAGDTDDPCLLDFNNITAEEDARFNRALDEANENFTNAGISDWNTTALADQISEMNSDLETAGDTQTFLENEFDATACP